ncbi:MAG: saccharopine dehydrogenase NADP-binding domain-containing protein [Myxococcota bacterium]
MSRTRDRSRRFDIVLWGATGFTGKLVAEYFVEHYLNTDLKLALAGRSLSKLEALRTELARLDPAARDLTLLVGDSFDKDSLSAIAKDTEVVCTTVGPYAKYGAELVAACVDHGTDYCDLTGETLFIREMIDLHHKRAQETGARIVHCCGFDSIPSDIGTWMMHRAMEEQGATLREVRFYAGESKGGLSGGTIASMLNLLEQAKKNPKVRKVMGHPYGLNPEGERSGPDGSDFMGVRYDRDLAMWVGPFIMAAINTRIVRRTNAILGFPYGRDFRYSEVMSFGRGPKGFAMASSFAAGMAGFVTAASIDVSRKFMQKRFLPKPGEGPSREAREKGYFVVRLVAEGQTQSGESIELRGRVEGRKDPGYGETAKMLGESALCLALDGAKLETPGGVRTPASTMGDVLLQRLRDADMVFQVR